MAAGRVTARDVARHAGVSQSTVSYVLNDNQNQSIPASTRAKVRRAAEELNYTPSAAARALRRGSSESVLVVLPDAPLGENVAQVIEAITEMLEPHGYAVVYRRQKDDRSLTSLRRELMPAAIVNIAAFPAGDEAAIEETGVPVIGSSLDTQGPHEFSIPQAEIGRVQVRHLVERGHRHIAFGASTDPKVGQFQSGRLDGLLQESAERGLPAPVVIQIPFTEGGAALALQALVDRDEPVTAVGAYNDEIAFAVLAGMRRLDLVAPGDLAVIGVDNISLARFAFPPLTTVDIHADVIGYDVGRLVLRRLKPELELTPPPSPAVDLVLRSST